MTVATPSANRAPHPSGLADVLDLVLDKGIVIDAYVRLSLVGIEILTLDARIVIASVDTYLRFAEAVNRLDIQPEKQPEGLPGLIGDLQQGGAKHKTRGALDGVKESAKEVLSSIGGEGDGKRNGSDGKPRARRKETAGARPARTRRRDEDED